MRSLRCLQTVVYNSCGAFVISYRGTREDGRRHNDVFAWSVLDMADNQTQHLRLPEDITRIHLQAHEAICPSAPDP